MAKFSFRSRRVSLLVAIALSAAAITAPQTQAFDRVVVGTQHFFHCLVLMITDPVAHEAECSPGNTPTPSTLAPAGIGPVPIPTSTVVPDTVV